MSRQVLVSAQDAGLKSGAASLAAGKYSDAVRQLSATINSDNASAGDAAKALYLRGIAYRKIGEQARAAADLGAAIWLGLPEPDRVKALVNRGLAFRAAGLSKEGEAETRLGARRSAEAARSTSSSPMAAVRPRVRQRLPPFRPRSARKGRQALRREPVEAGFRALAVSDSNAAPAPQPETPPTRTASTSPQWSTTTSKPAEAAAPGAWSTSVAGAEEPSSSAAAATGSPAGSARAATPRPQPRHSPRPLPQTAAAPPRQPSTPPSAAPAASASSSWSTTTEDASAEAGGGETKRSWRLFGRTAEAEPTAPAAAQPAASGGYQLQLANSRSEDEAKALWKKVSQSQGLAGVSPAIEKIDIGNFGTFYSLKIGPFPDKAQSVKVCNALKRNGIDCSPVTL